MISFHPMVRRDVAAAMRHYESVQPRLADDFWSRFETICAKAADNPRRFHFDPSGWRRAKLRRFPYHILFQEELDGVRVMVLRHDRRNPAFGSRRK